MLFGITACAGASMILSPVSNDVTPRTTYRIQLGGENNDIIQVQLSVSVLEILLMFNNEKPMAML